MAIEYSRVKAVLETAPLNKEELAIIAKIEKFIDNKILAKFDGDYISLDTQVVDFKFNPDNERQPSWNAFSEIKSTRKQLMKEELMRRYEEAGWEWEYQEGEDDGPNRPAIDYWHLKGRN